MPTASLSTAWMAERPSSLTNRVRAIEVAGMKLTITGEPAAGDSFTVSPSQRSNIFSVLDKAIEAVRNGSNTDGSTATGALTHAIAKGLAEIDTGMSRMQTVQSFAGDLLNRADRIETGLSAQSLQQEADRSRAEDLDMIPALSEKKPRPWVCRRLCSLMLRSRSCHCSTTSVDSCGLCPP